MGENGKPKYEGETVRLGGQDYVLPGLSVKQVKNFWPQLLATDKGVTVESLPEKFDKSVEVIHAALSRNYPEVTRAELEDLVDTRNMRMLMLIIMGQSGLKPGPGTEPAA